MSDRDNLIKMFDRAGVEWEPHEDPKYNSIFVYAEDRENGSNLGYMGFFSSFGFTDEGELESIGSWE